MSLLLTHSQRSGMVRNGLAGYYDLEKRNLIRFSQQLDNPAWGASQATITADAPSPLAPNGSASADKVEGTGTDGSVSQTGITILASTTYTYSVWLRVDVAQQIQLSADDGFGAKGTSSVSVSSTQWIRFSTTFTTDASASSLSVFIGGGGSLQTGDVAYVWGAQLNEGSSALPYEETTDNQSVRDLSGKGNNGQLGSTVGADTNDPTWETHKLNFTTDDYVVLPALLAGTDEFTLITVYQLNAGGSGSRTLAAASNLTPNRNGIFHNTLSNIKFRVTESGGGMHTLQPTFSSATGSWRMLTARWKSGQAQELVLNDFEDSGAAAAIDVPSGTIANPYDTLGSFRADSFLDGKLACQLFYDRYLADTEIKRNYRTVRSILSLRGVTLP